MDLAKLRARMTKRNVAGTKIPRQDRTSVFLENQLRRAGKTGYAGESGVVEGGAARPRLDRPARAAGGRVMKPQNSGDVQRKVIGGGKPQDHEDRTERPREDEQYKGRDYEKQDGSKDAYEHRNDGGPKGGEQKTTHWATGGKVVNDHEDHGAKRKKRDLERHDRLKNHEHEDTAYHGSGDGEHEELFAKGGKISGKQFDHSGGAKEREEVLHRHDRLKNEVHESSHYDKHGWDGGPYGKGFPRHKAEMHHHMPGQVHPTGKAHGGSIKASDDYDGHGHFKGDGFEHIHKAQLYAGGGQVNHSEKEEHPEGRRPPPHQQPPPREKNEIVGRETGGKPPPEVDGGSPRFSSQAPADGQPIAGDNPHADGGPGTSRTHSEISNEASADYLRRRGLHEGVDAALQGLASGLGARGALMRDIGRAPFFRTFMGATGLGAGSSGVKDALDSARHIGEATDFDRAAREEREAHGGAIHLHHEHHHHIHHESGGVAVPKIGNVPHAHHDSNSGGMKGAFPPKHDGGVPDSDNRSIKREGRMEGPVHREDGGPSAGPVRPQNFPPPHVSRKDGGKWIQHAVPASHKGRLHKALHVPEGEKIPEKKLEKAEHSDSPHMRHMAQFAESMKGVGKK